MEPKDKNDPTQDTFDGNTHSPESEREKTRSKEKLPKYV